MARYTAIHPGEILKFEFLDPLGITPYALSKNAGIDKGNLSDVALRLARFFGTSADSWMNLQSRYDLETAMDRNLRRIEREVRSYESLLEANENPVP
jgi:addiction module HigA family antidote